MKRRNFLILFFLCALLLSSCADSPEGAAKEWYNAMINMDGNKILDRTCVAQREAIQEVGLWTSAISLIPQLFGVNIQTKGDVSGIKFTVTNINEEKTVAQVRVHGEIRMAVLAFAQAVPVDETWLMIKEDDTWRWCGIP